MGEQVRVYAATIEGLYVFQSTARGWEEAGRALPGAESECLAGSSRHPERVYLADLHNGLYGTDDAGRHWSKLLDGEVWAVAVDPTDEDVLYAGTEPIHLYRSEDRGESWEELSALQELPEEVRFNWWFPQPPHQGHVYRIFIHPEDPSIIYLALEHGGIVRSFDRGATWEDVSGGIDYPDMHFIRPLPGTRNRYFVSSARGFFTSDDPARGWTRAENGFTRDYFHSFIFLPPSQPAGCPTMLIATADKSPGYWLRPEQARSAIFRSVDCAQSWQRVGAGLPEELCPMVNMLVNHPTEANGAFAALGEIRRSYRGETYGTGAGTLMVTHDRGDTWQTLPVELPAAIGLWAAAQ